MNTLLKKEMQLSALLLTYLFIGFGFMTLVPGYPILCGVFFVCLGIYQSFQSAREANDIVYSALLPVAKRDVVRGKYLFSVMIELAGFLGMALLTLLRMTLLSDSAIYRQNALMNANPFFLGMALLIFGMFNLIFLLEDRLQDWKAVRHLCCCGLSDDRGGGDTASYSWPGSIQRFRF